MTAEPDVTINLAGDASPADDIPELHEGAAPMDLPERARLQADGSVWLDFLRPVTLKYRQGSTVVKEEPFSHLVLGRLNGAQVRPAIRSNSGTDVLLAASTGMSRMKLALLIRTMDAADCSAATQIVTELLGGMKAGLPAHARESDAGVMLPLLFAPRLDGNGELRSELMFRRLTGGDLQAIAQATDTVDVGIQRGTGLSPKAVTGLVDRMDGADFVAAQQVIAFLAGLGARIGR